jgi:cell division topological specificity factor
MNIFSLFSRQRSAPIARERLQILLAHERAFSGRVDLLAVLREEILAVIKKHLPVDPDRVQVKMDKRDGVSTLAVDIEVPGAPAPLCLSA